MRRDKRIFAINFFTLLFFVIDRVLKIIFAKFSASGEFFIFGDWFRLKLSLNPGIAFGLPLNFYLILVFYILVLAGLIWFLIVYYQKKNYFYIFFLSLIVVGAFSNFLDRLYGGQVIDYIDLKYYSVFNLADTMIVFGVIGILIKNLNLKKQKAIK